MWVLGGWCGYTTSLLFAYTSVKVVQEFLDSTGLDLTVVMDTEGDMGSAYMAESIPQMVIIGKDGLVSEVHIGVGPDYENDIRKVFTELTK